MRKTALDCVYELAKKDKRVVFVGSDLGAGVLQNFKDEMPERFIMVGVSEQAMIGIAAGLAHEGHIVYVNTIATFITRRCFEQNVLDLGLHKLPVRLIGSGGGLVYAPLGPTHLAIDDVAIIRTIPNMTIIAPADSVQMRQLIIQTLDLTGPLYVRVAKGFDPVVSSDTDNYTIGKANVYGKGRDALIITTGITLGLALEASGKLGKYGIHARIIHFSTLKPMDTATLALVAKPVPLLVSVEEHTIIGGLGSMVAEFLADQVYAKPKRLIRLALPDAFPEGYGSQAQQMEKAGISVENIVQKIRHAVL